MAPGLDGFTSTGLWDGGWEAKKWLGRYIITIAIDSMTREKSEQSSLHPENSTFPPVVFSVILLAVLGPSISNCVATKAVWHVGTKDHVASESVSRLSVMDPLNKIYLT
jgi:hypothetical protein